MLITMIHPWIQTTRYYHLVGVLDSIGVTHRSTSRECYKLGRLEAKYLFILSDSSHLGSF